MEKKEKKILSVNGSCIDKCSLDPIYKYEYDNKCYNQCEYGYFIDQKDSSSLKCKCRLNECLIYNEISLNISLCISCNNNDGFYEKENDPLNMGDYIKCYNETPEGYYLDKKDLIYKNC